ncbi:hypothetical protein ACLKA7_002181 [Drosophila subpalustris]
MPSRQIWHPLPHKFAPSGSCHGRLQVKRIIHVEDGWLGSKCTELPLDDAIKLLSQCQLHAQLSRPLRGRKRLAVLPEPTEPPAPLVP